MRPTRLSTRLGITVTATSALLVLVMALFACASISRQLELRAREVLQQKIGQIEHSLAESSGSAADLLLNPHNLRDQVIGHDDLTLSLFDSATPRKRLLHLASQHSVDPPPLEAGNAEGFQQSESAQGADVLTAYKQVNLRSGQKVMVMLSLDRQRDDDLLSAYFQSTLIGLPFILLLVGGCTWWAVHRGLKPLRTFRKVAQRVTAQDLSHRMTLTGLPDELRDLAQAVNVMLERLDGDVQQLTRFSDDLAHELRSPMNNLMGKAQVTLSRERPPHIYKQVLESCTEELERLSGMVSQMLFLASVSRPSALPAFRSIDLRAEAEKVAELFAFSAEEKQVHVQVEGQAFVLADPLMVQRAISNLLSNAIRHALPGSTVTLALTRQIEEVSLAVGNVGEGIEAQHLPRLFDRFYRVHASRSRQQGGTGLGLAIVRSIMQLHDGRVTVASVPGGETVFGLVFANKG
jgi:two-component system heavy metal sensor histidine kinase CusS